MSRIEQPSLFSFATEPAKKVPRITKTSYLNYLKCPQEFWLEYHHPELFEGGDESLEYEHLRQQGYAVERYVKELSRFWTNESQTVDFERVFQTADLLVRADVVITDRASGNISIFEIKGSSSVKDEHYDDVAFQRFVAERSGLKIDRCYVITMNSEYVRHGEIEPEQLFVITDVTDETSGRLARTEQNVREAFGYLDAIPVPSLMDYCTEHKLSCRYLKMHFPGLPDYTVFDIAFLKHDKRRELLAEGIIDIKDVPDGFRLSDKQRLQVDTARSGQTKIDREAIRQRICSWTYPLHFLDYETFAYAVPQFEGVRPFQQMCFQYSLHTIDAPGGEMTHTQFLSKGEGDPPRELAVHLSEAMSDGIGTVFVWYEAFEKTRNSEMGEMFPEFRDFFEEVNAKTCDLMKFFSDGLYVHPEFRGRTSIKKVLPVLCPELSYKELGIGDGLTASISWFRAAKWATMPQTEKERIFSDLEKYCELDTLAMVSIFDVLKEL